MKSLFKKPWFTGTLILSLMVIVLLLNLWVMSLKLQFPYDDDTLLVLAKDISSGNFISIYSFILMIAFYGSIVTIILSGFSAFRKKNWGFIVTILYFILFDSALIVFQSSFGYLPLMSIVLIVLAFIFTMIAFVILIFRSRSLSVITDLQKEERNQKLSHTKIPFTILILDLIAVLIFLSTFFIPLYSEVISGLTYYAIIINVLLYGNTELALIIYFFASFMVFLSLVLYSASCLSYFFFDKEKFIEKSKTLISFIFSVTIAFFLMGLTLDIIYSLRGDNVQTISYIPMLLMCILIFIYAIFKGKYGINNHVVYGEKKTKYAKVEPLVYVLLISIVSVLTLLLPIIKINITSGSYDYFIDLTGFEILRDYAILDPGYRMVAFMLVVMLISVGIVLVISISSYLSKYKQFSSIVKLAAGVNFFFAFIIGISGYYFQIAKEINQAIILDLFDHYGFNIPALTEFDYTIGTDAVYALLASTAVLILMFIRKAFERENFNILDANLLPVGSGSNNASEKSSSTSDEEVYQTFDPCPAFTDLDLRVDSFKQDLEKRKAFKTNETTLNELVHFVVEYARNSRLHLSYTPEDIATFVAGLGASRLSILQGMSGTGKTSLPKIFSEAVFGNCEIIEVESSWKDKNELLGYYNEFSMKYTPKKFTLALYKAALNQEIFTFILLDEMNLSRIEYYFSDFLSLMENEENQREIKLININLQRKEKEDLIDYLALNNGNTLKVPPNVWFIGTANRDESTFVISDKVYDRAHTMNFTKRAPKVRNYSSPISKQYFDYETVSKLFNDAKQRGQFDAENSDLIKSVEVLLAPFNISFGNRILKQIEEFVNIYKECFPKEDVEAEAIEKILLSKVVAKLEVKTIDDKEKLEMEFEKLNLNQCASFIKHLDND